MENSNLHLKLREERIKQGLSQKELGEIVGLPQQAINRIEQGQRKLDIELFEKLCKALKIKKIGSFSVNFISSYYETDISDEPYDLTEEPQDENIVPNNNIHKYDASLKINHNFSHEDIENLKELSTIRKKIENGEKLTENELQILKDYNQKQESDMKRLRETLRSMQEKLIPLMKFQSSYEQLNEIGQKEATKRIEELTEIPRYTKSDDLQKE